LAVGDFPPIDKFKSVLQHQDFGKFPKLNVKLIEGIFNFIFNFDLL